VAVEDTEFGNLIGSDKVEGTAVYGADGESIGSIERVMLDKKSGKASYAVLSFGGFPGMGADHYPIEWNALKYNPELGGYQIGLTAKQLEGAPRYSKEEEWDWNDPARFRTVDTYYNSLGIPPGI